MTKYHFPIYREAQSLEPTPHANQGLVFNKWVRTWKKTKEQYELDKQAFLRDWHKSVGQPSLMDEYHQRLQRLVNRLQGITFHCKNIDAFVTGMGLPHPLENGLIWHHTLGIPYIPGSTLKGVLREWLENWLKVEDETIHHIFGKGEEEHHVGAYYFFDVLPVKPVKLQVDIMTPHYQEYFSGTSQFPHEHSNPIPIPFLTIAPDQIFSFSLAPMKSKDHLGLEKIRDWIIEALSTIGLGAKTAAGYGRFEITQST